MTRVRALIFSLAVAAAAIAGVFALGHSLTLGAQAGTKTTDAQVARRAAQLDRYRATLVAALSKKPPPLPPIPTSKPARAAAPVQVVYRRAAAVPPQGFSDDDERSAEEHDDD